MRAYWYWPFVRPEELPLADAFAARGHSLTVHTIADRVPHDAGGERFVNVADLPGSAPRTERSLRWVASRGLLYPRRARMRDHRVTHGHFDVAHVVYLNYFTDGLALRRLARHAALVSTVHDVVPHQSRVPHRIERALLAAQYAAAGTIVVHHPDVGTRLHAEFGVDPARIHHVPWAVPHVEVTPRPDDPDPFVVLLFGTLRRNKGVDVLLRAFTSLPDRDLRLVVAGRGFAEVEAAVRGAAARDDRIHAEIGPVPAGRKHALYRDADLVVLPYTSFSSQSAVLHDAYAHHRPVLVTEVGALGSAVRSEATGWVVEPGRPDALAAAILDARADAAARRSRAAAAGAIAQQRSPGAVAEALEHVYRVAAAPGKGPENAV